MGSGGREAPVFNVVIVDNLSHTNICINFFPNRRTNLNSLLVLHLFKVPTTGCIGLQFPFTYPTHDLIVKRNHQVFRVHPLKQILSDKAMDYRHVVIVTDGGGGRSGGFTKINGGEGLEVWRPQSLNPQMTLTIDKSVSMFFRLLQPHPYRSKQQL